MLYFHDSLPTGASSARAFTLDNDITGVFWNQPEAKPRSLVLIAHGGGQSAQAPNVMAWATLLVARGYDSVALDAPAHGGRTKSPVEEEALMRIREAAGNPVAIALAVTAFIEELSQRAVPEWRLLLDEFESAGLRKKGQPVGFWGLSLGAGIGFALMSVEPRVRAGVLGLVGDNLESLAHSVSAPVQFLLQWDDQMIKRESSLRLFEAIGSQEKTLHANPGDHHEVPHHEHESAVAFFDRHLTAEF